MTHPIIPAPAQFQSAEGHFQLLNKMTVFHNNRAAETATQLVELLGELINTVFVLEEAAQAPADAGIWLDCGDSAERDERYELNVTPNGVALTANHPAGLFYAVQTLCQLVNSESASIPAASIVDQPRFGWRGLHLDVGRHMFPVAFIKKYIDMLARHKFNVFHWHLTEDQGWRIEIKRYPKLTEISAFRDATPYPADRHTLDGKRYGGFYTQDEVREVVAYAQARHVTVVPEIEMPGHTIAVLAAYPELGCVGSDYQVRQFWGIEDDVFCPGTAAVYTFLENVLSEVFELFPSEFIHVGGDECPKVRWETCPKCQAMIEHEGLKDEHGLQSYFIQRMERFINANGRRLIGWDEILEGGLAPNAAVMSWRGTEGGIAAAKAGHHVVMSPTTYCYLDYYQSQDQSAEPPAIFGFLPLEKVYEFDPTDGVPAEFHEFVLGGQGNVWTEYMPTTEQVEYMVWPRAFAIAEAVWSSAERRDYDAFLKRVQSGVKRLEALGVNYRPIDG